MSDHGSAYVSLAQPFPSLEPYHIIRKSLNGRELILYNTMVLQYPMLILTI